MFAALLMNVPAPGRHWVSAIDIEFCHEEPGWGYITRGLKANGVELTRVIEIVEDGARLGLAFTLAADGTVTR